jgi:hypothetical protein
VADNTTLNPGVGGDLIRDIQRSSGTAKTQIVALDIGGAETNTEFLISAGQAPMSQSIPMVRSGDQPSDPALVRIADLLTKLLPQTDAIFSPFEELNQNLRAIQAQLAQLTSPSILPVGATQLTGQVSGNNASQIVTFTGVPGRTIYLAGFQVAGLGATAAFNNFIQVTGLVGGSVSWGYGVPAGVGVAAPTMPVNFIPPLVASGPGQSVVITLFAFGAGNVGESITAWGYMI